MKNKLDQLKTMSTVVADSGDINAIQKFAPEDATTNPSLLLKAAKMARYIHLVEETIIWGKKQGGSEAVIIDNIVDKLAVNFGLELLKIVPGRVSTEVDASLSFNTQESVRKGRHLISLYKEAGVSKERVLIKLAATWEGIKAAEILEREGINCNLTLLFGLVQAVACAEAKVFLISPFVGRIMDWYAKAEGKTYAPEEDPGVRSVTDIFHYYKKFGYKTVVMGASFRNTGEIEQLAGCDRITISPHLLEQLQQDTGNLPLRLDARESLHKSIKKMVLDESAFRWMLNQNAMATEKLVEGIRSFYNDTMLLKQFVARNPQFLFD